MSLGKVQDNPDCPVNTGKVFPVFRYRPSNFLMRPRVNTSIFGQNGHTRNTISVIKGFFGGLGVMAETLAALKLSLSQPIWAKKPVAFSWAV